MHMVILAPRYVRTRLLGNKSGSERRYPAAADCGHASKMCCDELLSRKEFPEQESYLLHSLYQIPVFISTKSAIFKHFFTNLDFFKIRVLYFVFFIVYNEAR